MTAATVLIAASLPLLSAVSMLRPDPVPQRYRELFPASALPEPPQLEPYPGGCAMAGCHLAPLYRRELMREVEFDLDLGRLDVKTWTLRIKVLQIRVAFGVPPQVEVRGDLFPPAPFRQDLLAVDMGGIHLEHAPQPARVFRARRGDPLPRRAPPRVPGRWALVPRRERVVEEPESPELY